MTLKIYIVGRFSFLHGLIKMIPMKTGYKVCDAMTKKPIVVSKTKTIAECARIMQKEKEKASIANMRHLYVLAK